jgi:hypothetical protein
MSNSDEQKLPKDVETRLLIEIFHSWHLGNALMRKPLLTIAKGHDIARSIEKVRGASSS